jgi:HAD superfamily hydrolase (TIGR01509 family)
MNPTAIFDMDGVLIDSLDAHWQSWDITCKSRNISLSRERYEQLFGSSFSHFAAFLAPDMTPEERQLWYEDKEKTYRQAISQHFPEMPGASALIEKLKADGFRLGVASSGPRGNVNLLLEKLQAGHLIEASCSATEVEHGKPNPDVFLKCAALLGVHPNTCIVIEDSIPGLQAAKAAGMLSVALVGTRKHAELVGEADHVVEHLDHITPQLLKAYLTKGK